MVATIEM